MWFENTMAADAWTSMYVLSARGLRGYLDRARTEGFGVGVDKAMFLWCAPGECFTLYSGQASPTARPTGVLNQQFANEHNTIEDDFSLWATLERQPEWELIAASIVFLVVLALCVWACCSRKARFSAKHNAAADGKAAPLM